MKSVDRELILMAGVGLMWLTIIMFLMAGAIWVAVKLGEWIASLHWTAPYSEGGMIILWLCAMMLVAVFLIIWGSIDDKQTNGDVGE